MGKHYTVLVLDASGSMGTMRDEAMSAFNEQLRDIRQATKDSDIKSRIGFVKFASTVQDIDIWDRPIGKVNNLQKKDYKTGGLTAMLDGVGAAIDKLMDLEDIDDENTSVLVNIISDGNENNSKEYSFERLSNKIKGLTKTGRWTFTYTGANQYLSVLSERMNIPSGNMSGFVATSKGMEISNLTRSKGMSNYFSSLDTMARGDSGHAGASVINFYSSVETQTKDD